jgi:hypothetical protein
MRKYNKFFTALMFGLLFTTQAFSASLDKAVAQNNNTAEPTTRSDAVIFKIHDIKPIDKKDFKVIDVDTGSDASILINDNPEEYWTSDNTTAQLVIDMQKEYDICAVGHYPARLLLKVLMAAGISIPSKINEFVIEYVVSVSSDGKNYKKCAEGLFRVLGSEEYVTFPETRARYVKFEAISTAGKFSERKEYENSKAIIGELTVYSKK